jgi:iron complex outermembrane receptor protein
MPKQITSLVLGLLLSNFLSAQETVNIQEIIVTADFRQQSLARISNSISVLNESRLERQHISHLDEALQLAPNVNFASGSNRARFYQIRGIGERGQFSEPLNPSVGLMIDGVDFSGAGNAALLYDVEQVEILMGPQGTRYGSNALAGLINIRSKAPTAEASFGVQIDLGNYDSRGLAGYLSGPLTQDLQFRFSAQQARSDGFSQNLYLHRPTNQRDESLLRGKLNWQVAQDIQLELSLSRFELDNGYDAFSLDNIRDTLSDEPGFDRQVSDFLSSTLSLDGFRLAKVELIAALSDSSIDYGYDEDWSFIGLHPFEYSSTDRYLRERENASAELRLLSRDNSLLFDGRTSWVLGFYHLQQDVSLNRLYTYLTEPFSSRYRIDRSAIFADTSTELNARWSLDLGLRLEHFDADYHDSSTLSFTPQDSLQGGKVAVNYLVGESASFYLSAARGYKAGGFNTDGSLDPDLREFGDERLWNYELGYKGSFDDNRLQVRSAIFYMDRKAVQIASSTTRLRADLSTAFIDYIGNAAQGKNLGLELNANWQSNNKLNLQAILGILKTRYENFINSAGDNLSGREQAHAPSYQFSLGGTYSLSANLDFNISVQGKDRFYFSDSHNIQSGSYALWHASIDWQLDQWRVGLWGRNLGDKDYHVRGFYFGNDPRDGYTPKGYTQLGEPRRIGLTLSADF